MVSANHEASQQLVPAGTADRFVDPSPSPSAGANGGPGPQRIELQHGSLDQAAALLREATKYYERHVIAWYTLGRLTEARSARDAIVHYPRVLAAGRPSAGEAGCLLESERSASAQ